MTARTLNMVAASAAAVLIAAVFGMPLAAQPGNQNASQGAPTDGTATAQQPAGDAQVQPAATKRVIVVSLEDRKLALVEDGKVKKIYTVAVGKPSTPSPVGTFTIERRVMNPTYSHDGRVVPPGPGNPVGTRWMGLSIHGYGIHGTNEPKSIGKAASHGCIRMAKADLEELYPTGRGGRHGGAGGRAQRGDGAVVWRWPDAGPAQPATLTDVASRRAAADSSSGNRAASGSTAAATRESQLTA